MIVYFKMIINNLLRKLFTLGKSSFLRQNINNLKKRSQLKNPLVCIHLQVIAISVHYLGDWNNTKRIEEGLWNLHQTSGEDVQLQRAQ